jgi:hypothetical protein
VRARARAALCVRLRVPVESSQAAEVRVTAREQRRVRREAVRPLQYATHLVEHLELGIEPGTRERGRAHRGLLIAMRAVVRHAKVSAEEPCAARQRAHHPLAVLVRRELLVPRAHPLTQLARPQHRARRHPDPAQPSSQWVGRRRKRCLARHGDPACVRAAQPLPRTHRDRVVRAVQSVCQRLERAGCDDVVGIEKHEIRATRERRPVIARAGASPVALEADGSHGRRVARDHVPAAVGRGIVDDDVLDRRVRLCRHRCDRLRHKRRRVVARRDDGDERGLRHRGGGVGHHVAGRVRTVL